jgi:tryptophan-rich sensory protein
MKTGYAAAGLLAWLALCFAAAGFGSLFPPGNWYAALAKPAFTPPALIFAPVWTALYLMMAVAAWLVWKDGGWAGAGPALTLFLVQLALNAQWSYLFFGLHRPGLAWFDILALWLALLGTVAAFWRRRPLAGALLLPYLFWVSFAAVLNFALWRLNP